MFPVVPLNNTQPQPQSQSQSQTQRSTAAEGDAGQEDEEPPAPSSRREGSRKTKEIPESAIEFTSIKDLRRRILAKKHQGARVSFISRRSPVLIFVAGGLREVLEGHVFVGIVDLDRCLSLVQHSTQLYLLNHGSLA